MFSGYFQDIFGVFWPGQLLIEHKSKKRKKLKQGYRQVETEGEKYNYLSSHTFRRTKLSNLYKQGIPEYHIMGISGHTKSETLHAYLGIDPNKEARTLELKRMLQERTE